MDGDPPDETTPEESAPALPEEPGLVKMEEGGETEFIPVDEVWYEVHTFRVPEEEDQPATLQEQYETELSFSQTPEAGTVEVLVVAGGGGGVGTNGAGWRTGGYISVLAYPIDGNTIQVRVGKGGAGGVGVSYGNNGGNSAFSGITTKGGGGDAKHGSGIADGGNQGGSGGGTTYYLKGEGEEQRNTGNRSREYRGLQ